ncbi:Carbon monoxide dehydrogenase large chain [Ensifer psoraleae]|uniref:xanthine dehydrogenase family protein molybdopterin-binding subunit n=1 Tax=Sinorhizobium psoraleae TaxID=520838 RepID=UPI0015692701|nr:xanthine dehydrogenase family protein molybdopterin-binding subunit [Sinorhizobium psoraleae]NRP72151.1 Carbon monoxide dehydrogenase large chain [Sinorhizobium psoraleae]
MQGIAQSAHRLEDRRFLVGAGRYLDDVRLPRMATMAIVRSPHAHARILSVDTSAAEAVEGVLAVLTAEELAAEGISGLPCLADIKTRREFRSFLPSRPILATGTARYAGEPVAAVIAETPAAAREAAECVLIEYDALPAVVGVDASLAADDRIWDEAPDNICFDWHSGDRDKTEAHFAKAAHVVSLELDNNRVAGLSLETRGVIGDYDTREDRFTLYVSSQGGHSIRRVICQHALHVPENRMRVITPDVGGGFGPKIFTYGEYVLALVAARRLGRPVKWVSDRMESLQSDTQGRAQRCRAELAMDAEGRFLAMRFDGFADAGAYPAQHGPNIATVAGDGLHPAIYDIQSVSVRVRGLFTNTVPVDSYRGAGRPEVIYAVERLVQKAAEKLDVDPAELRKKNLVSRDCMPFRTITGQRYDDGDFARLIDLAVEQSGFDDRERIKADARSRGKLAGFGLAYFIDRCGRGLDEFAELRFDPSGSAILYVGSQTNGQGHETAYAQVVANRLGIERNAIRVVQGDTDQVAFGRGTGGSRALAVGGNAVHLAADKVLERTRLIAAFALGVEPADLSFDDGIFRKVGTNETMPILDAIRLAFNPRALPPGLEAGMSISAHFTPDNPTFPNGCHICHLEIDKQTGVVELKRYIGVNDVGTILDRRLVEGQFHGGLAQGIGQALLEQVVYDVDTGQMLTGSLMDYCYPKADDFIDFELDFVEIPCRSNPLGVKGCGEAGAIAAPPAVANAVMDALAGYDTSRLQMPFTSNKIFEVLSG